MEIGERRLVMRSQKCAGFVLVLAETDDSDAGRSFATLDVFKALDFAEPDPETTEPYLRVTVKWDGCAHFDFGAGEGKKRDGYLHMCGPQGLVDHSRLMWEIWTVAHEAMSRAPEESWPLGEPLG